MISVRIKLPENLPADVGREISKRSCYCDQAIGGATYDLESNSVVLKIEESADQSLTTSKVNRLIEQMSSQRLAVKPKLLKQTDHKCLDLHGDIFGELASKGDLHTEGTGVVARGGDFLRLLDRLDSLLANIGTTLFAADVRAYNSLVPTDWLRRAGYFSSFPHSVTFAMHLTEDMDSIDNFAKRNRDAEKIEFESFDELTNPEYCLSPAVCYHTYGELEGTTIDKTGLKTVTAAGRCFRYESKNITDLDRLWEFSMREIIFVGEKEKVLTARSRAMGLIWNLIEQLGLQARLETASDPFFSTDFKSLRHFQLANDLKYELIMPTGPEREIAVGSFNYHENFFGNRFNIATSDGSEAHTGCAAFGLERLLLACLAQLGIKETIKRFEIIDHKTLKTTLN